MAHQHSLSKIADQAVKSVTAKVAHIELGLALAPENATQNADLLLMKVQGDYELLILFYADPKVMRAIARSMKRGALPTEQDLPLYLTEFFNILCGHVVSAYNHSIRASARFGLPQFITHNERPVAVAPHGTVHEFSYRCHDGAVFLQIIDFTSSKQKA